MDHAQAPMLDALAAYHRRGRYGFTPPGHRQGRGADQRTRAVLGDSTFGADVLATAGLDDRQSTGKFLARAEELMADAVGADTAFFSTCGSSLSVKAAMMAVAGSATGAGDSEGGLLVARDSHKSIVAGLIFSGVQPHWISPRWDAKRHLSHPPSPAQVRDAWKAHPHAAGALVVSPSPYGTCADIAGIARVCHEYGKPLIIDEAWGAHLPFHEDLPTWAMDAGADICVVSVHKMGTGFEQGSVFHTQGDLVDPHHLSACADLLMTTSPSVIVYAALDGWRRQMVQFGHELLSSTIELAKQLRQTLSGIPGVELMEEQLLGAEASHDLDRMQVLLDVSGTGFTGYAVADWLREHHCIDMGLSDHRRVLATLSIADNTASTQRLIAALADWRETATPPADPAMIELPAPGELELESVMTPREAFFGPTEMVSIKKAAGRISAEQITPYPPGIPAIVPGERISAAVLDYLTSGLRAGMVLPDPTDPELRILRVAR